MLVTLLFLWWPTQAYFCRQAINHVTLSSLRIEGKVVPGLREVKSGYTIKSWDEIPEERTGRTPYLVPTTPPRGAQPSNVVDLIT